MIGYDPMLAGIQVVQASVMVVLFAGVIVLGLLAGRWRKGDLRQLDEWALGGRKFGGFLTWFLQGGSVYTTYSFIAIPALVFGAGAAGFYALPFLIITYPVAFIFLPRLWQLSHDQGYVTSSDFVRDRFGHPLLSLLVTVTGIVAILPYAALQVYGIEVSIAQVGLPVTASLWTAFVFLAIVTYVSGLRSATLIAVVKDVLIWITVLVAVIYIPIRLGGYADIFNSLPRSSLTLAPDQLTDYSTLAIGSALVPLPLSAHHHRRALGEEPLRRAAQHRLPADLHHHARAPGHPRLRGPGGPCAREPGLRGQRRHPRPVRLDVPGALRRVRARRHRHRRARSRPP